LLVAGVLVRVLLKPEQDFRARLPVSRASRIKVEISWEQGVLISWELREFSLLNCQAPSLGPEPENRLAGDYWVRHPWTSQARR
jgi:hypothetical protein